MSLAFLDLETTGLDPDKHDVIEVACVITDDDFKPVGDIEMVVHTDKHPREWDEAALEMHSASGLLVASIKSGCTDFGPSLGNFLRNHYTNEKIHLCGNSIHFDFEFLRRRAPYAAAAFHYRRLDVSSLRMVGERITKKPPMPGDKPHRAMADVRRSIEESKYWVEAIRNG